MVANGIRIHTRTNQRRNLESKSRQSLNARTALGHSAIAAR